MDEGYALSFVAGLFVVDDVPFVDPDRVVRRGRIVVFPALSGDATAGPDHHSVGFAGGRPCDEFGRPLPVIAPGDAGERRRDPGARRGVWIDVFLCMHPVGREFADYHELVTTYVALLSGHAQRIDPAADARTRRPPATDPDDGPFTYRDTASARAGLVHLNGRLAGGSVGIVGLGGTGGYVLDLVAKTPVERIHLFDDDEFLQHNAFRAPGAPTLEELAGRPSKVDRFAHVYSAMHRGIVPHRLRLGPNNFRLLDHLDFAFLCVDDDASRDALLPELVRRGLAHVDVGMGLFVGPAGVDGLVRTTTVASAPRAGEVAPARTRDGAGAATVRDDAYRTRLQVADLNALNAALAVVSWKRLAGFYASVGDEGRSAFLVGANRLLNGREAG